METTFQPLLKQLPLNPVQQKCVKFNTKQQDKTLQLFGIEKKEEFRGLSVVPLFCM